MQKSSRQQQQNPIRMIDRIMSSDTEYHIATLNRYYPCFKSKPINDVDQQCQVTSSSSVDDDEVMDEDTSNTNSMDVAMDDNMPSSQPTTDDKPMTGSSESINASCYRRQRAVSYTDEVLIYCQGHSHVAKLWVQSRMPLFTRWCQFDGGSNLQYYKRRQYIK